jgi:parallel beta-helix repeat protein
MKKGIISILVCMLMIGAIIPVSGTILMEKTSQILTTGYTLYVGGSGSGNYTKIQDAIDNATEGDTVYVYDDASPYVENIVINTSLSLIGEDKETTIINGSTNQSSPYFNLTIGIVIFADDVLVKGFTIQDCNLSGILLESKKNCITENIFSDDEYGVTTGSENAITNNLFIRNSVGIYIANGSNSIIGNMISHNNVGIGVVLSMNDNISNNIISENNNGVYISGSYNTFLFRNNISKNDHGVYTWITSADKILENNFIGNNKSAESIQNILIKIQLFKKELNLPIRRNVWDGNYWDKPRSTPYMIPGMLRFWVDWHPAQEPYDIPPTGV